MKQNQAITNHHRSLPARRHTISATAPKHRNIWKQPSELDRIENEKRRLQRHKSVAEAVATFTVSSVGMTAVAAACATTATCGAMIVTFGVIAFCPCE